VPIFSNREICASAGQCVRTAGEIFDQDNEGVVIVLNPTPEKEFHEKVRVAVSLCPSGAITFIE
jgi:ferredoxin